MAHNSDRRIWQGAFHLTKAILSRRSRCPLRGIPGIDRKIESHESLVARLQTSRPRSFATIAELAAIDSQLSDIHDALGLARTSQSGASVFSARRNAADAAEGLFALARGIARVATEIGGWCRVACYGSVLSQEGEPGNSWLL